MYAVNTILAKQFDNDLSTVALTLTNSVFLYLSTVLRHRKTELENRIFNTMELKQRWNANSHTIE